MRYSLLTACLFAWLLGAAAPAYAQPAKVVIDSVRVGFITGTSSGAFKTSQWAPVYVSITAGPERIDRSTGVIVVEASDTDDVQNQYTVDLPPLAAGEAGLVITYVRPGNTGSDINVTIKERPPGIRVFASTKQLNQMFDGMAPVNVLYVTAGARPRSLKSAFTIKKQPHRPEPAIRRATAREAANHRLRDHRRGYTRQPAGRLAVGRRQRAICKQAACRAGKQVGVCQA